MSCSRIWRRAHTSFISGCVTLANPTTALGLQITSTWVPTATERDSLDNDLGDSPQESCRLTVDQGKLKSSLDLNEFSPNCTLTQDFIENRLTINKQNLVDDDLAVYSFRVFDNGTEITVLDPVVANLAEGVHHITVESTIEGLIDDIGNVNPDYTLRANSTGTYDCDFSPPELSVAFPAQSNGCVGSVHMETRCEDAHGCAVFCQMDGKKIDGSGEYGFSVAETEETLHVSEGLHTIKCFSTDPLENMVSTGIYQFYVDCTGPEVVFNLSPDHVDQNGTVYDSDMLEVILMTKTDVSQTFTNYELKNEQGLYANIYNPDESLAKTNSPEGSFEYTCRHEEVKFWDGAP
eukprot:scaffold478_cov409-Prasinococcus_capsulatus_cf.AAC.11